MKSVQRKFGTLMKRSENEADVQTVLAEFKAVDEMLDRLIKDLTAWRNSWEDILKMQYDTSEAFADLYKQIEPSNDPEMRHQPQQTPAKFMQKCLGLQQVYSDEKTDLAQEVTMISRKLITPAEQAKQHTKLLHKTLKHRDNMKLDYERYLSHAEHLRKKQTRSERDETMLAKREAEVAQAQISYQTADEQVKQTFPPVSAAVLSLLPYLLSSQVILQATLVGQLYTVLDAYTKKFGFPSPAPPDADIVTAWDNEFTSLRREVESGIPTITNGKAVHLSMALPVERDKSTLTGLGIRNKVMNRKESSSFPMPHRPGGQSSVAQIESPSEELAPLKPPRPGGVASARMPSYGMSSPGINLASKPKMSATPGSDSYGYDSKPPPPYPSTPGATTPGYSSQFSVGAVTPPSQYQTPLDGPPPMPGAAPNASPDYFGARRVSQASSIASNAASIAAKKKPPPPIPAKRLPSGTQAQYVTAVFEFEGQSAGDLAFKEGDRIKIVKKTDSTDDWWDGELNGKVGAFPANYVQL